MKNRIVIVLISLLIVNASIYISCEKEVTKPHKVTDETYDGKITEFIPTYEEQGTIDSEGGIVEITSSSSPIKGAFVEIPIGALSSNADIKIEQSSNAAPYDENAIVIKMEPAGLEFDVPIKIGLPYDSSVENPDDLQAYYFNKDSMIIEEIPIDSIDYTNRVIIALTDHFSEFYSGKAAVFADIEMVDIDGKIGAKVKLYGKNNAGVNVGFKYGTPLSLDVIASTGFLYAGQAFEEYFNAYGYKLHSTFGISLKEVKLLKDPVVDIKSLFVRRDEVYNNTPNEKQILSLWNRAISGNTKILTTKWITDEDTRQKFYSGEPIVFTFDNYTPDPNKKYYVEVEWATAVHPDGFFISRLTPLYKFTNYDERKTFSELITYNADDDNNGLDDVFQEAVETTIPTVSTSSITDITTNSATCGGNVTSDGGATVTARGVCWSTSSNPTISNSHTSDGSGAGTYSSSITGLSSNTTYYVRAYATNINGTSYGSQKSFTTKIPTTAPTVSTSSITDITTNSATGGGNVTSDGGATVTARGVCWSTSSNPTVSNSHTTDGTGTGSFTSSITGLSSNTAYYVRAYATNSNGTSYGNQVSFTTNTPTTTPTVTTSSITDITTNSATGGGNVTSDGGATVTARGVCWSTSQNPTVSNSYTTDGSGTGSFTSSITGLSSNTAYYVRAYATNSEGTAYGDEISFTTQQSSHETGTVTDIDGNVYKTVKIGNQWWMAENLKVSHYRNGDAIPNVTDNTDWSNLATGAYSNYGNDANNAVTYGSLYNWYAVGDSRNIVPEGWHVPSDEEWKRLEMYLGMSQSEADESGYRGTDQGSQLAGNADLWYDGDLVSNAAFGSSGFAVLPGGYRGYDGYFSIMGYGAYFWSSTETSSGYAWRRTLAYGYSDVARSGNNKRGGFSVRCVRD